MGKQKHTGGNGLFIIMAAAYVGMLILFAWQTWFFVDWLYPNDQILMKVLTLICFDIMAFLWGCLEAFYRFATSGSRSLVRWAAAISFLLSLITTIFYMVLESIFRYHATATQEQINIGYAITIVAVTGQFLFLFFWLYGEWTARHPHYDDYEVATPRPAPHVMVREDRAVRQTAQVSQSAQRPALPAPRRDSEFEEFQRWKASQHPVAQPSNGITISAKPIRKSTPRAATTPTTTQVNDGPVTEALDEIADAEEAPAFDEETDEEIDDGTYTKEVVAIVPGSSQEAANAGVPLGQRLKNAAQMVLGNDDLRGPKSLQRRR